MPAENQVTQLLLAWGAGDRAALDQLTPLVYAELRRLAASHLSRQQPGHTLQATALVHEAYVKLADQTHLAFRDRSQFFGIAAAAMRSILVDHARGKHAAKRGGNAPKIVLEEALGGGVERGRDVIALDDALNALAAEQPRKARMIELRFFGGLNAEEISQVLDVSTATITRELRLAEAWLRRELSAAE